MKKLLLTISLVSTISQVAMASPIHTKGEAFTVNETVSHFYGGLKTAESEMWKTALKICEKVSEGENNTLVLNRLSDVVLKNNSATWSSSAEAMFICQPVGRAE